MSKKKRIPDPWWILFYLAAFVAFWKAHPAVAIGWLLWRIGHEMLKDWDETTNDEE